jgi:hypothetical protein
MPLNGMLVMKQAKIMTNSTLKVTVNTQQAGCRNLRGITLYFFKICGDKVSANHEAAEKSTDKFAKITADGNVMPEQC